jgi:hypothetical protein
MGRSPIHGAYRKSVGFIRFTWQKYEPNERSGHNDSFFITDVVRHAKENPEVCLYCVSRKMSSLIAASR